MVKVAVAVVALAAVKVPVPSVVAGVVEPSTKVTVPVGVCVPVVVTVAVKMTLDPAADGLEFEVSSVDVCTGTTTNWYAAIVPITGLLNPFAVAA